MKRYGGELGARWYVAPTTAGRKGLGDYGRRVASLLVVPPAGTAGTLLEPRSTRVKRG